MTKKKKKEKIHVDVVEIDPQVGSLLSYMVQLIPTLSLATETDP